MFIKGCGMFWYYTLVICFSVAIELKDNFQNAVLSECGHGLTKDNFFFFFKECVEMHTVKETQEKV